MVDGLGWQVVCARAASGLSGPAAAAAAAPAACATARRAAPWSPGPSAAHWWWRRWHGAGQAVASDRFGSGGGRGRAGGCGGTCRW
ncbi:hypothetical protein [Nodularia spumigena]|uniref:hypothetical protein n=1 Tax=Nodularia spumigena TaxID=70799 RepID=UPI002B21889B|nr:hypothetical protein [Nodularia spumigena]MEA5558066.1 hypothetical protein [Nodularia spumigena CH309]